MKVDLDPSERDVIVALLNDKREQLRAQVHREQPYIASPTHQSLLADVQRLGQLAHRLDRIENLRRCPHCGAVPLADNGKNLVLCERCNEWRDIFTGQAVTPDDNCPRCGVAFEPRSDGSGRCPTCCAIFDKKGMVAFCGDCDECKKSRSA